MTHRVSGKRSKAVAVHLTRAVYELWLESLTAKELAMVMLPPTNEEMEAVEAGSRKDYLTIAMQMPGWWVEWYKQLSKEDKFKFAKLVEKRLRSIRRYPSIRFEGV